MNDCDGDGDCGGMREAEAIMSTPLHSTFEKEGIREPYYDGDPPGTGDGHL